MKGVGNSFYKSVAFGFLENLILDKNKSALVELV